MGAKLVNEVAYEDLATSPATAPPRPPSWPGRSSSEGLRNITAGSNPMAVRRGIDKAVDAAVEHLDAMAKPVTSKDEIAQVGAISANNDRDDRQPAGRRHREGRQGRRDHRRGRQDRRDRRSSSSRACSSTRATSRPYFINQPDDDGVRARGRLHPDPREEDHQPPRPAPAAGEGRPSRASRC